MGLPRLQMHALEAHASSPGAAARCRPLPANPARCTHCPPCAAVHGLHTPRFTLDEGVLKLGAALHTALASSWLEQAAAAQGGGGAEAQQEL